LRTAGIQGDAIGAGAARLDDGRGQRTHRDAAARGRRQRIAVVVGHAGVAAHHDRIIEPEAGLLGVAADREHGQHPGLHRVRAAQCGALAAFGAGDHAHREHQHQHADGQADQHFDHRETASAGKDFHDVPGAFR
jgi:hypothetical protein